MYITPHCGVYIFVMRLIPLVYCTVYWCCVKYPWCDIFVVQCILALCIMARLRYILMLCINTLGVIFSDAMYNTPGSVYIGDMYNTLGVYISCSV
jgi:hypothetical protein